MSRFSHRFYSNIPEIMPYSTKRVFRKRKKSEEQLLKSVKKVDPITEYRENEFKIQMLSRGLFSQIFKGINTKNEATIERDLERYVCLIKNFFHFSSNFLFNIILGSIRILQSMTLK